MDQEFGTAGLLQLRRSAGGCTGLDTGDGGLRLWGGKSRSLKEGRRGGSFPLGCGDAGVYLVAW